ncbi:MAG: hypothetical protein QXJ34_00680 [Candidatus Pacearchaeota archaeon]
MLNREIAKRLDIPKGRLTVAVMAIGYPTELSSPHSRLLPRKLLLKRDM